MNYYELEKALYNVTSFADFEEFAEYNKGYTQDLFNSEVEEGYIQDITRGTYNGATDTFTPWELNNENLFDTILSEIHESDFYNMFGELETIERQAAYNDAEWIEEYCLFYNVFTIGNRVYI